MSKTKCNICMLSFDLIDSTNKSLLLTILNFAISYIPYIFDIWGVLNL